MNKACPIVLRHKNNTLELLVFKHPHKGIQLIKGGIKKGESLEMACVRELEEESGVKAQVVKRLGQWEAGFKNQIWGFSLMHYEGILADAWDFETKDDGGYIFSLFWQPLNAPLDNNWNEVSKAAFSYIRQALSEQVDTHKMN